MKQYLQKLIKGSALSEEETYQVFERLMGKSELEAGDAEIGAYLYATGLRLPQAAELIGAARALRQHMVRVPLEPAITEQGVLDTCGTGGSGLGSFNVSTAVAIVCAAAGQYVCKHGNRGVSSASGSVDVLEALNINYQLNPKAEAQCCARTRFCFMFAPKHHPATARVARVRRELGFRTIFNFLGPLANPAAAQYQLLGVSSTEMLPRMAEALNALGTKRAMIVCGSDGLDEISLSGETLVNEINGQQIKEYRIKPDDFGFSFAPQEHIRAQTPQESADIIIKVFSGKMGSCRNMVLLNSGAALFVGGKCASVEEGIKLAAEVLDSGKALASLQKIQEISTQLA